MLEIHYSQTGLAQSGIGIVEAEDVLYDGWTRRQATASGFAVHGRSLEGRLLELEIHRTDTALCVQTGRELNESERARYRRRRFSEGGANMTKKRADEPLPPRRVHSQVLGLRMDEETMRWLDEVASNHGISASVLARKWVLERLVLETPAGS